MVGFRPWGPAPWLLSRLQKKKWSLLTCLSPEERSIAAWEWMLRNGFLAKTLWLEVRDPESSRFYEDALLGIEQRRTEIEAITTKATSIEEFPLLAGTQDILDFVSESAVGNAEAVVIDISTMPKRFFFPLIRFFLGSETARDVLVLYTSADRYADGPLAEDHDPWSHVPTFAPANPKAQPDIIVVSSGFDTLGLPALLEGQNRRADVHVLSPFPPMSSPQERQWRFLHGLAQSLEGRLIKPKRVDARDVPEIFEHLAALSRDGTRELTLAPYGPKTISLAMLLYALSSGAGVFYTQPKAYNGEYSRGVSIIDGQPNVLAYCLRLSGEACY